MNGSEVEWRRAREASRDFGAARRRAWLVRYGRRLLRRVSNSEVCCEECCDSLLCFVGGSVKTRGDRRLELVELGGIVGSVGRCSAFDGDFLPTCSCTKDRWERVYSAMREGRSLPPVVLYKIRGGYYVVDGNHRVSVARILGLEHLEALVTEVGTPPPRTRG